MNVTISIADASVADRARLASAAPADDLQAWAQRIVDEAIASARRQQEVQDMNELAAKLAKADPATKATVAQALSKISLTADAVDAAAGVLDSRA